MFASKFIVHLLWSWGIFLNFFFEYSCLHQSGLFILVDGQGKVWFFVLNKKSYLGANDSQYINYLTTFWQMQGKKTCAADSEAS
ncbi:MULTISPECIES: hypothetical protein [unclassified Okeania]|uniref:hypothetical protein n=1 Tax=unclassified Okeania TaxID=2634635 RepID=UPI0013BD8280|nr:MULTISPECIES: hypothetical protein [unclassified Okeania]NES76058.1 hypothetical protein [Okeania sp. SIO1H4]NET21509.1 hypothetical protein [Okeania sp. SIO1H5]NET94302.1 hypothetical protein [Okeania sp. SIO1H2]